MPLECNVCSNPFDSVSYKPVIGICGHSLCCICRRNCSRCPLCNCDSAFDDETVNYQLLEFIDAFNHKQAGHVAEITEVRNEFELLKKEHGDRAMQLEALRDEKSSMSQKICELEKKVTESVADEERFNESRWKCHECSYMMEQQKSRICLQCGEKTGIVCFENGTTLKILDVEKADSMVFCASCGLDGEHKGHHTIAYLKLKFLHDAGVDFAKIIEGITEKMDNCDAKFSSVKAAGQKILEVMRSLCSKAENLTSLPDYDDLFSHCQDVKDHLDSSIAELQEYIDSWVKKTERLENRLQHVLKDEPFDEEEKPAENESGDA